MLSESLKSLRAPLRLVIDLTSCCNLRCAYCCFFTSKEESLCSDMSVDRWVDLIDEAGRSGVVGIILRGGEALLSPAFRPVIEAIVRNRMRFSLLTNGKEFTDEIAGWLASTGRCDQIKISLDGREEIHDAARGKGAHAGAVAGIAAAHKAGLKTLVTAAVHKRNWQLLPDTIKYLFDEMHLPRVTFSAVTLCENRDYELSEEEFREAVHLLGKNERREMVRSGMYGSLLVWRSILKGEKICRECLLLRQQFNVFADGRFVPCTSMAGVTLGYFGKTTIEEAWAKLSSDRKLLSHHHIGEECAACPYVDICKGSCYGKLHDPAGFARRHYFCLRRQVDAYGSGL